MNVDEQQVASICSVCHDQPTNAIALDCNHIFCYMCIKSVAERTGECPLCRRVIEIEFNFQKHKVIGSTRIPSSNSGYYWFYEGYEGWWLYDADTNNELEENYRIGQKCLIRFIAGYNYLIDLENMTQGLADGNGRLRKIMRSTLDDVNNILGMAGLRSDDFDIYLDMMKSAGSDPVVLPQIN